MDEITMIREFLAEPSPPGPQEVAAARERLAKRISGHGLPPAGPRLAARAGRRLAAPAGRRLAVRAAIGVATACAAAALVIAALVTDGMPNGPARSGAGPVGALTGQPAREFLLAMATKAGHSQVGSPATGRYWCSQAISGTRELVGPDDKLLPAPWLNGVQHASAAAPAGYRYAIFTRDLNEACLENPRPGWPGGTTGGFSQSFGARPASPADAAARRRRAHGNEWPCHASGARGGVSGAGRRAGDRDEAWGAGSGGARRHRGVAERERAGGGVVHRQPGDREPARLRGGRPAAGRGGTGGHGAGLHGVRQRPVDEHAAVQGLTAPCRDGPGTARSPRAAVHVPTRKRAGTHPLSPCAVSGSPPAARTVP